MTSAQDEIRAVIEQRIAAMRRKDAAAAVECLADDAVAFELAPPLALPPGAAKDADGLAAWLSGFEAIDIEVRDLEIETDGAVGFARALHHLKGTRAGGRPVSLWMRSTLCFRLRAPSGRSRIRIRRCRSIWTGVSGRRWIWSPRASPRVCEQTLAS